GRQRRRHHRRRRRLGLGGGPVRVHRQDEPRVDRRRGVAGVPGGQGTSRYRRAAGQDRVTSGRRLVPPAVHRRGGLVAEIRRPRRVSGRERGKRMRKPLIAGNWKMNKTAAEAAAFGEEIRPLAADVEAVAVVRCPPVAALRALRARLRGSRIGLGAQSMHEAPHGAYTGEVSAAMLKEAGCGYVILGHSERRRLMGGTDEQVNAKVKAALAAGLRPIVCVGESLEQRRAGETEDVVVGQVRAALRDVPQDAAAGIVIAYEPVWAIGTGETPTPDDANQVAAVIRSTLAGLFGEEAAAQVRIQYGGSVNADNIASFAAQPHIDGALVGGASLAPDSFARIVRNTEAILA